MYYIFANDKRYGPFATKEQVVQDILIRNSEMNKQIAFRLGDTLKVTDRYGNLLWEEGRKEGWLSSKRIFAVENLDMVRRALEYSSLYGNIISLCLTALVMWLTISVAIGMM